MKTLKSVYLCEVGSTFNEFLHFNLVEGLPFSLRPQEIKRRWKQKNQLHTQDNCKSRSVL